MQINIKETLIKISDIWHNLIKRYSFTAFVFLPLFEWVFSLLLLVMQRFGLFCLSQLLFFILNICIIVFLYQWEEKHSKYIQFIINNKFYNVIIFFVLLISLWFLILSVLYALCAIILSPYILLSIIDIHIFNNSFQLDGLIRFLQYFLNILLCCIDVWCRIIDCFLHIIYLIVYNSIKLLWAIFVTFMMSLEPFFV